MLAPSQPVRYKYNGQVYNSLEEAQAAMRGQGAPAAVAASDSAATLERIEKILDDPAERDRLITDIFRQYAGADGALQQNEMVGLGNMLCCKIGIDRSHFENIQQMFYRFDWSGDGALDLDEAKKLIKFLLKEQRRMLKPSPPGMTLCSLPRKILKDEFDLGKKLGEGGQGAVYLAKDKHSGTSRVVKFYNKDGGNSCLEDIKDEFELLKRMDHPNIARICEVFEDYSNIYVVSEPYGGGDLVTATKKAKENGIPLTNAWLGLIFLQTLEGIAYLHSKQTMHCDLKEPNVMIADDNHWDAPAVMIIDFGMAKNFSGVRAGGTPGYMPPEFWQCNLWTPKGDIFALAVTFWGIYNFKQGGPFQVPDNPPYSRIQQATISAPMDCSRFPEGLSQLVAKMAEKDFRNRPTAVQVLQDRYFAKLSEGEEKAPLDKTMVSALCAAADRSALQNMIALEIASTKNLGQMRDMTNLFRQLDKDDDGTIDTTEALEVLTGCGFKRESSMKVLSALIGKDGKIRYSVFMAKMIAGQEGVHSNSLTEVFQSIDKDGSGTLDRSEIEELMQHKNMDGILEGRTAGDLIREMDTNGDGVIDFDEFRRAMLGQSKPPSGTSHSGFAEGDDAEYYSASYGQWVPCKITDVNSAGDVQVSVKPGAWLNKQLQETNLRKAGQGGGYS